MEVTLEPLISVGMPVFNSELTLANAISAILGQDYSNFELIISDNASTDSTRDICNYFSSIDSRIRVTNQIQAITPTKNFAFVLSESRGKYFTWAAGDDVKSPNFLSSNIEVLRRNPNAVASMGHIAFEYHGNLSPHINIGKFTGSEIEKFKKFLKISHQSHGMIYSLMKTEIITKCEFIDQFFFGWDWAINLFLLGKGEILVADQALTVFGINGISNSKDVYKIHGLFGAKRMLPFLRFNKIVLQLVTNWKLRDKLIILSNLTILNLRTLFFEFRLFIPFLGRSKRSAEKFLNIKNFVRYKK